MKKVLTAVIIILVIGMCYFILKKEQPVENKIISRGCFDHEITKEIIDLNNSKNQKSKVTVKNTCGNTFEYYLVLSVKNDSVDDSKVILSFSGNEDKVSNLEKNTRFNVTTGYLNSYILYTGEIKNNKEETFELDFKANEKIKWNGEIKVVGISL